MRRRRQPFLSWFVSLVVVPVACSAAACTPDLAPLPQQRSARGTIGEEVYKSLCRRVAGTEMPLDVSGRRSQQICLGDASGVANALAVAQGAPPGEGEIPSALPSRVVALAERRAPIAQAVDDMMPGEFSDELEHLFRRLLPFYDAPFPVQEGTRSLAAVIERLTGSDPNVVSDPKVMSGFARVVRKGMLPYEANLGLMRGSLGASGLRDMARKFLPLVADDVLVRPHFDTLLDGLALELATIEVDAPPNSDLQRLKRLLLRTHPDFGSGKPLYGTVRDARGLPTPTRSGASIPFPFVDANGDNVADADGPRLLTLPTFTARLPEPFPATGEGAPARDPSGRAFAFAATGESDPTRLLYETQDSDTTLLAGLLRTAQKLFRDDTLVKNMSAVGPLILGPHVVGKQRYGLLDFAYPAPDPTQSAALDLVHGGTALLDRPVLPPSLALTKVLLDEHEPTLVAALKPLLALERRTRDKDDAYPEAKLPAGHTFWDEILFEVEKLSRRRISKDSDTLLEAMMRASLGFGRNLQKPGAPIELLVDPELLRHQGVVLSTLMRFKDEWRANPTGESKRVPGDPVVLGSFRTPVDRSLPDTGITCGRDGCGGLIEDTAFLPWRKPEQNCMIQRQGRPISGKDCGERANQSLLQRSLGLISEMAGRSQCNKPISIGDLLDFAVLKDPCTGAIIPDSPQCNALRRQQATNRSSSVKSSETAVRDDYACPNTPGAPCRAYADKYPAAFVDPDGIDGGQPASIQACHMINLPDVGRTFGDALTHEFRIDFPNPWVRRYLEDIAFAGKPERTACASGFRIADPTVDPGCTPSAARLSRDIYEDMPATVDELGELVEFLLDDTQLFANDADTRDLRPDVKALSRVLFAPAGSTSFILFDPLLLHGAPPSCEAKPALPVCDTNDVTPTPAGGCCIKDITRPPLRYRLDTYYGSTSFAWEQPIKLTDGKTISFLDTMRSLSDAVAQFDFDASRDDPKNFEDTGYVFSTIGKLVAQHYDSKDNPAVQSTDPKGLNYRRLTGLTKYERLLADALDDGMIDRTQAANDKKPLFDPAVTYTPQQQLGVIYQSMPLLQLLDTLAVEGGVDGIKLSAQSTEELLSPHARCAGATGDRRVIDGVGACDRQARGEPGLSPPFVYRNGTGFICWEDGRCFDGKTSPKRFPSPLYVLLDAIDTIQDKADLDPELDSALSGLIGGLIDTYAGMESGRFDDRRVRALVLALIDDTRTRISEESVAGTLATLPTRTDQDAADVLHNPIIAGALGLSMSLKPHPDALTALTHYTSSSLSEDPALNNLRPLLGGLFDAVQLLPGDAETNAALRAIASAFADKVEEAVAGKPVELNPQLSALGRNLYMLRQSAVNDTAEVSVLERMFKNLAQLPVGRPSPLEVILDAALEINRVKPGEGGTASAEDLRVTLVRVAQVLRDKRRGFERLYQIVKCTTKGKGEPECE
ncbi:MAG: hypothetical protein RLZZ450_3253 [Pseudomonadota bacterium]|jgi:hypothetical protein